MLNHRNVILLKLNYNHNTFMFCFSKLTIRSYSYTLYICDFIIYLGSMFFLYMDGSIIYGYIAKENHIQKGEL